MGTRMGLAQRLNAAQSMVTSLNTHLETGLLVPLHLPEKDMASSESVRKNLLFEHVLLN
jgi:hypothetical protein